MEEIWNSIIDVFKSMIIWLVNQAFDVLVFVLNLVDLPDLDLSGRVMSLPFNIVDVFYLMKFDHAIAIIAGCYLVKMTLSCLPFFRGLYN